MLSYIHVVFKITNVIIPCKQIYVLFIILKSEDQEILIEDEHGNTMPALTVFSESLKYLKQSLLDYVNDSVIISMDDIKWVITVPAIWSDPAKTFMRRAAIQVFHLITNLIITFLMNIFTCRMSNGKCA